MTRSLPLMLTALAAMALSFPAAATPAQPEPPRPMITGGWTPIPTPATDPEVRAAARVAVAQLSHYARLRRIESAERQVVAGMNYRLVLRLNNGQRWKATVWRKLDGVMVVSQLQRVGRLPA